MGYHFLMCYRYVAPDCGQIVETWGLEPQSIPLFAARFNTAPTSPVPVLLAGGSSPILDLFRWGLIPFWWKQDTPPRLTFNARSEEASQKPTWREPLRSGRCLMPARGWYEWATREGKGAKSGKQPYFIYAADEPMLAFAAVSDRWAGQEGGEIRSCALLTRAASPALIGIHNRMPLVLPPELHQAWLKPNLKPGEIADLIDSARTDFFYHPVGDGINSVRSEGPDLIIEAVHTSANSDVDR